MPDRAAEPEHRPAPAPEQAASPPASLGDLVALGGPVTPGVVLASQERVGNRATTEWLGRAAPGGPGDPDEQDATR